MLIRPGVVVWGYRLFWGIHEVSCSVWDMKPVSSLLLPGSMRCHARRPTDLHQVEAMEVGIGPLNGGFDS